MFSSFKRIYRERTLVFLKLTLKDRRALVMDLTSLSKWSGSLSLTWLFGLGNMVASQIN